MCGRYALWDLRAMSEHFDVPYRQFDTLDAKLAENYNIAPTQTEPTITQHGQKRQLELMRWGFLAPWMKDLKQTFKYSTFNARSEDIFDKPLWKHAIRETRCIVPANGFYEWQNTSGGKQPFYIRPKQQELFGMAGLYSVWEDAEGAKWPTYAILTTSPSKQMESIHNRMPVILNPGDEARWLETPADLAESLEDLMRPYPDGGLEVIQVSKNVNSSRTNDASLIKPMNPK